MADRVSRLIAWYRWALEVEDVRLHVDEAEWIADWSDQNGFAAGLE